MAVTARVPPLQPGVPPLLHLTAGVWQQRVRGEWTQTNSQSSPREGRYLPGGLASSLLSSKYRAAASGSRMPLHEREDDQGWCVLALLPVCRKWRASQHRTQTAPSSPSLSSRRTSVGTLCLSLSWDEAFFLWENVSSCLRSSMDLTITSREPMRRDQRLRGRLQGSEVMWQTTPCLKREQTRCQRKQWIIPLPKKSNLQKS